MIKIPAVPQIKFYHGCWFAHSRFPAFARLPTNTHSGWKLGTYVSSDITPSLKTMCDTVHKTNSTTKTYSLFSYTIGIEQCCWLGRNLKKGNRCCHRIASQESDLRPFKHPFYILWKCRISQHSIQARCTLEVMSGITECLKRDNYSSMNVDTKQYKINSHVNDRININAHNYGSRLCALIISTAGLLTLKCRL